MMPLADTRILVVEDERPVRMLLRVVLEAAGARVVEAEDGWQALRLLDLTAPEEAFDLVLSDLNMPRVDGAQLVRTLRMERGADLPVVLCTAMGVLAQDPSLRHSIQAVVTKPVAPTELVRTVAEVLAHQQTAREAVVATSAQQAV